MVKASSDRYANIRSFLSAMSSGGPEFTGASEYLCNQICPGCNELSKEEFKQILREILSLLSSLLDVPIEVHTNTPDRENSLNDRFLKVSRKSVVFLRDNDLGSEAIVKMCRSLEHLVLHEINEVCLDDEGHLRTLDFFSGLQASLIDQWVLGETHEYQRKLRKANRYILLEKRRYYTIFSRMIEPAFIIDYERHIVDSNRAFKEFFGLQDTKHIGMLCYDVMGPDVCAACALHEMLDSKRTFSGIEAVIPVLGEVKTVLFSGTFLGDINSEFSGGIVSIQDITYNKEIEQALQESEEKYRSLVENVPDVTWRSDQYGNMVYISPNIEKVCGYQPDEICGTGGAGRYIKIHPQDVDRVRNDFAIFFAHNLPSGGLLRSRLYQEKAAKDDKLIVNGQKKYDVRYRFQKKDGSWIWLRDRASTVYQKDGEWYADGVFSDISELKRAEDELEKHHFRMAELVDERTADLRLANKMLEKEVSVRRLAEKGLLALTHRLKISNQELEQFAHIASHDIKEPLILVLAFSERLLRRYSKDLDERGREYLIRLIKAAEQMKSLVEDLLELSRISSRSFSVEMIDLTSLVDEVVQGLEERINRAGGEVDVANLGFLNGDPIQLRQLFQNIIANALKYSNETKKPFVEIKQGESDKGVIEILIEDNGIGFDPSQVEHIFEPFARLHANSEYDGTGIGLATCKKIVLRHGGEITAESTPGLGSRFIVRLPVKGEVGT